MNHPYSFLTLEQPCNDAVAWLVSRVSEVGLQVVRTFDFQEVRNYSVGYRCPHHGTEKCDCQMVVLLVYGDNFPPISLVARGFDDRTWFSLVDTPQQHADPHVEGSIRSALKLQSLPT